MSPDGAVAGEGVVLHAPSSWHHGLVADCWATVNLDAAELDL
jgi:hypothetical protein